NRSTLSGEPLRTVSKCRVLPSMRQQPTSAHRMRRDATCRRTMTQAIENLLIEERSFPPSAEFAAQANVKPGLAEEAAKDPEAYWKNEALTRLSWFKEPTQGLDDSNPPFYKWVTDGEINVSYNCLDRHLADHGDQVAYHWVGEPGDTRTLTYRDLYQEVCRFANALKSLGLSKGDRV